MSEVSDEIVDMSQYLTFASAGCDYAIPIMRMKEIVPYTSSTNVPMAPGVIRGLINLRGRAIPVLDLAMARRLLLKLRTYALWNVSRLPVPGMARR